MVKRVNFNPPRAASLVVSVLGLAWLAGWSASVAQPVLDVAPAASKPDSSERRSSESRAATAGDLLADTSFFIEQIRVDGLKHASERILLAEARLEPGQAYSEAALREAIFRINRLAFVLDARFSLERGSERGAYTLVVTVREIHRFFFGVSAEAVIFDPDVFLAGSAIRPPALDDSTNGFGATVGARHFVGSRGMAFAAASPEGVEVGYVQHDLFGRGGFFSATVAQRQTLGNRVFSLGLDPLFAAWDFDQARELSLEGGVPIAGNHALRFRLEYFETGKGVRGELLRRSSFSFFSFSLIETDDSEYLRLDGRWLYDTTDDPVLPTRGRSAHAGVAISSLKSAQTLRSFDRGTVRVRELPEHDARWVEVFASAVRHWPLSRRQSVSVGVRASLGRSRVDGLVVDEEALSSRDLDAFAVAANARYSLALRNARRRAGKGEVRLELNAGYAYESTSPSFGLIGNPVEKLELGAAIVYRTAWGLFRFGITYLDAGEVGP